MPKWVCMAGPVAWVDQSGVVEWLIVVLSSIIAPHYTHILQFRHGTRELLLPPPTKMMTPAIISVLRRRASVTKRGQWCIASMGCHGGAVDDVHHSENTKILPRDDRKEENSRMSISVARWECYMNRVAQGDPYGYRHQGYVVRFDLHWCTSSASTGPWFLLISLHSR